MRDDMTISTSSLPVQLYAVNYIKELEPRLQDTTALQAMKHPVRGAACQSIDSTAPVQPDRQGKPCHRPLATRSFLSVGTRFSCPSTLPFSSRWSFTSSHLTMHCVMARSGSTLVCATYAAFASTAQRARRRDQGSPGLPNHSRVYVGVFVRVVCRSG